MWIDQAGRNELLCGRCGAEPQDRGPLACIVIEAAEDPCLNQHGSLLQRSPGTTQDPHRIQQQGVMHGIRGRLPQSGRSRFRSGR